MHYLLIFEGIHPTELVEQSEFLVNVEFVSLTIPFLFHAEVNALEEFFKG